MTQEPTHSEAPETDTPEDGSLDAAALAFETRKPAEEAEDEPTTDVEAAEDDPNTEGDEAEPEADTDPEAVEVEYEGLKFSVPADKAEEVKKALLRQSDYSRKMNEVSAKEKTVVQTLEVAEKVRQGAEKFAERLAEIRMLDAQIKQFEGLNWAELRQADPAQYAAYAADLQSAKLARQQAEYAARAVGQEVEAASAQAIQAKRAEMFDTLKKQVPGWSDQMGAALTEYATANGVSYETLSKLTDPGVVIALEKARKFDALQKSKTELKAKVKDAPPVLKPGAPRKQAPQADVMARLRKSNSVDDAAAAFLSRMK